MAKKYNKTIEVKGVRLQELGKLLKSEEGKNYENILSAFISIEQTISELEVVSASLQKIIDNTSVEDVKEDLIERGLLDAGYEPVFRIPVLDGKGSVTDTYNVTLKQSEKVEFNISKDLNSYMDIIPPKYKEEKVTINKKTVKDDYHDDSLDPFIKPYCSETKTPITKIKKEKDYGDKD